MINSFTTRQIEALLDEIGIPPNSQSYLYLKTAISYLLRTGYKNPHALYKGVAILHRKRIATIKSVINGAVLRAWKQQSPLVKKLFADFSKENSITLVEGPTFIRAAVFFLKGYITDLENPGYEWIKKEEYLLVNCKYNLLSPYAAKQSDIFDEKHNLLSAHFQKGKKSRPKIS